MPALARHAHPTPALLAVSDDPWPLTAREAEVLSYVARGLCNLDVGTALGISGHTVHNHMSNIMAKLVARDRTHAVCLAVTRGILVWIDDDMGARR